MQPVILVRHKILAFQADCLKVKKNNIIYNFVLREDQ